jgi:hypothetical protein
MHVVKGADDAPNATCGWIPLEMPFPHRVYRGSLEQGPKAVRMSPDGAEVHSIKPNLGHMRNDTLVTHPAADGDG